MCCDILNWPEVAGLNFFPEFSQFACHINSLAAIETNAIKHHHYCPMIENSLLWAFSWTNEQEAVSSRFSFFFVDFSPLPYFSACLIQLLQKSTSKNIFSNFLTMFLDFMIEERHFWIPPGQKKTSSSNFPKIRIFLLLNQYCEPTSFTGYNW